jgi:hypothetical protein
MMNPFYGSYYKFPSQISIDNIQGHFLKSQHLVLNCLLNLFPLLLGIEWFDVLEHIQKYVGIW